MEQPPSVGRIVHYYGGPGFEHRAALIVKCWPSCVNLTVFDADGSTFGVTSVSYSEEPTDRERWCWPPRV